MRQRKTDKHLPPCVYHRHGAYYLVRKGKWIPLGKALPSALAQYARIVSGPVGGMPDLLNRWLSQARKADGSPLSANTLKVYRQCVKTLSAMMPTLAPHEVRALDIGALKRELRDTPAFANHCLNVLRSAFSYAMENGEAESNPVIGIKKFPGRDRERLLSPEEFAHVRAHANPRLALIIDMLFLTGQRVMDVVSLHMSAIRDEGIYFRQQKTRKQLVVEWSPELREAVEAAKALQPIRTLYLFTNRYRKPPAYATVYDDWVAACNAAGIRDTQMRDFRAMSLTSAEDQGIDPQALAGHSTRSMTERYLRAKRTVLVSGPSIGHVQKGGA